MLATLRLEPIVRLYKGDPRKNSLALEHDVAHLIVVQPVCVLGLLVSDLDRLPTSSSSGGVSQQLPLEASVHGAEQESSGVDCLCGGQDAMVLQDDGFGVAEGFGDVFAFLRIEGNAAKAFIDSVILIKPWVLLSVYHLRGYCR